MSRNDITGIHHVGFIVTDLGRARAAFERLGFTVGAPKYPALPATPGGRAQPIGAGNTHADFPRGFIELVALAPDERERLPEGAELVPLSIPGDQLAATRRAMLASVANLETRLKLGEGAHILVFTTRDADRTAKRLDDAGVGHGGARAAQRPIATDAGVELAGIRFLEIDDGSATPRGLVPEGRVGAAEDAPAALLDAQRGLRHANGAVGLAECVVAVDRDGFAATVERYERYLGLGPVGRDPAVFDFGSSRLVVATTGRFRELFPGEEPAWRPGPDDGPPASRLAACTVAVADLEHARRFLTGNGFALRRCEDGRPFVAAGDALGAAVALEQAPG